MDARVTDHTRRCYQSKCRSPDGEGGYDCWAGGNGNEPFDCADGYEYKFTGEKWVDPSGAWGEFKEYTCCPTGASSAYAECPGFDGKKDGGYKTGLSYFDEQGNERWEYRCCPHKEAVTMDFDKCVG